MSKIDIKWNGSIETHQLINQLCHQSLKKQFYDHKKQIGPILQQLVVSYQEHSWTILKTHSQIKIFIQQYNSKCHTNLRFGSFMIKGLQQIKNNTKFYDLKVFKNFIEFQDISLNKIKSIKLMKKCGGRHRQKYLCCNMNWLIWKQRNFVITPQGILYHKTQNQLKQYIPFDKSFQARNGQDIPNQDHLDIMLVSNHRNLLVKAKDHYTYLQFLYFLKKGCKQAAKNFHHRYESFAPQRKLNYVQFKVDGEDFYRQVAKALFQAKNQIFIAGWWVSPQFYLVRPCTGANRKSRLDRLLKGAAERGAKIYILVYYQSSFLTNDSQHTKNALQNLHSNIKVIRHPLTYLPTFWSHHEKIIVIDQVYAFLGGLDLCYGRFDNQKHLINDNSQDQYPGIEYNNIRKKDLIQVKNIHQQSINRNQPRLPWHDVAMVLRGQSVKDVCKHFIQYWNFANFQTHYQDRRVLTLRTKKLNINIIQRKFNSGLQKIKQFAHDIKQFIIKDDKEKQQNQEREKQSKMKKLQLQPNNNFPHKITGLQTKRPMFVTIKEGTTIFKEQTTSNKQLISKQHEHELNQVESQNSDPPIQKQQNIINFSTINQNQIVFKAQQYFKQQSQKVKNQKKSNDNNFSNILRRVSKPDEQDIKSMKSAKPHLSLIFQKQPFQQNEDFINAKQIINFHKRNSIGVSQKIIQYPHQQQQQIVQKCQIVRSASHWSIGCKQGTKQMSIQVAYIKMIEQAKHFIYIQNQFFISSVDDSGQIKNGVVQALYQRISLAIKNKQKFKVMVLMPLVPGFAGQLDDSAAIIPRLVMHWQYKTICRHSNSLLARIDKITKDSSQYINFYGLRTHGLVNNIPMSQIVYLHSKLMIVDDRKLILGSANINDRSMQGSRDSQICCIVQGGRTVEIKMNEVKTKVSKNIHTLRCKLWMQHFGLKNGQCIDPLDDIVCDLINNRTKKNSLVYRQLFGCYPDDKILSLINLKSLRRQPTLIQYENRKDEIIGFGVQFPTHFLQNEDLTIGSTLYPNNVST